ncbi:hypothetical protein TSAR_010549 [Trichomalopsis sarcophagae]|uniref:Uncharacterized protein n=1 Tax=Trichomalopsis sarcophagae TaxID=543379 RepID=A0A232F5U0_9HYME|nr:hypothetical protein TSAR_010549 [Trichomalopsis sarcophagae]
MESKKKFNKNRYWKRKYQPRNASASTTVKKPVPNKDEGSNQSEDSEEEYVLKQRLPENGWFPDFDSSSSSSDVESLTTVPSSVSISDAKEKITKETKSDENWFNRELDNVQFNSNVPDTKQYKSIKESEIKLKLSSSDSIEKEHNSSYKLKSETIKKSLQETKKDSKITSDNEEDELEFLLSLTEPVHTGPIILKNNLENERRLAVTSNSSANDKPVKSIDLEKWLDSVLDD